MQAPVSHNLYDLICEQADRDPAALALIAGNERISYARLAERARLVAGALRAAGVRRGDRIGMLIGNRAEWVEVCLGAAAIGAVPAPFSTWSTARELEFLLADSGVRLLVALARFGERDYAADLAALFARRATICPQLQSVVLIDGAGETWATAWQDFLASAVNIDSLPQGERARAEDTAFVLFTSGSTSHPKAVPLRHGAALTNGFHIGERQGLKPGDRVFLPLPLFWSYGSANAMCATFTHGATLVVQERFEAGAALDLIERQACTSIYTLPAITAALIGHPDFRRERTASLRAAMTIGTPQDVATVAHTLGAREVCNIYGQTESYGNCCVTPHDWPLERRMACQGPPLPGVLLRIVDPAGGGEVARGQTGLIEVKGHLTPGYEGASREQNTSAFTADGYFRTGDLGTFDATGALVFQARDSEMIKRAGINIAPAEVEEVLRQHPGVAAAGVTGAPHPIKGEIVVAFVVPTAGTTLTAEALRSHCRALAATYKTPDHVEIRADLPVTTTGKLLRRELKHMAAALIPAPGGTL